MAAINSNPSLSQEWQRFSSTPQPIAGAPQAGGIVPLTVEPRHQFEKDALTSLGQGTFTNQDPRINELFDNFSGYSSQGADLLKQGASGFNQAEFDQYYNPYQEDVTDRSISRLNEQAEEMRANLQRQQASGRGNATFGDLYGAHQAGDIERELIKTSGDVIAQGNASGFNTALEALFNQRGLQQNSGQALANIGGQQVQGATALSGVLGQQLEQGLTATGAQLGAGTNIRDFNQNLADTSFQNYTQPILQGNLATDAALSNFSNVQGGTATFNSSDINRFGELAQGVGGIAGSLSNSNIRF